jgi:hypothetical protein
MRTLDHGNYRLYDLSNNSIIISRHVKFSENVFSKNAQPDIDARNSEIDFAYDTDGLLEKPLDSQSDLSISNLLETETESDCNRGGERGDGATTEKDSSADGSELDDSDEDIDSDNKSVFSWE